MLFLQKKYQNNSSGFEMLPAIKIRIMYFNCLHVHSLHYRNNADTFLSCSPWFSEIPSEIIFVDKQASSGAVIPINIVWIFCKITT